jgi:hypothetical protein
MHVPSPTKICGGCGHERPLSDYRVRNAQTGSRDHRCRHCHRAQERRRRAERRAKELGHFAATMKWAREPSRVRAMCNGVISRFGGLRPFCHEFVAYIHETQKDPRRAKQAMDGYLAITRLVECAAAEQGEE